jgi:hypothetical protein
MNRAWVKPTVSTAAVCLTTVLVYSLVLRGCQAAQPPARASASPRTGEPNRAWTRLESLADEALSSTSTSGKRSVSITIEQPKTPDRTAYKTTGQTIRQGGVEGWNSTPWNGKTPAELAAGTQGMALTEKTPTLDITPQGALKSEGGGSSSEVKGQKADTWWDKVVHAVRWLWDTAWWLILLFGVVAVAGFVMSVIPGMPVLNAVGKAVWGLATGLVLGVYHGVVRAIEWFRARKAAAAAQSQAAAQQAQFTEVVEGGDAFKAALPTLRDDAGQPLSAALQARIWEAFTTAHKTAQSGPTQTAVNTIRSAA